MDYKELERYIQEHPKKHVNIFISYLKELESAKDKKGTLKNFWFKKFNAKQAAAIFNKVAIDGLYIDGDSIIITYKGKPMPFYTYHAYKNILLLKYPESTFDIQLVYEDDVFSVEKKDGKVSYDHIFGKAFETNRKIIGCYCIIKNKRGDFVELINLDDIQSIRKTAKTQAVWNEWLGEMVKKSTIKRACKRHFNDVVTNVEVLDNENYDFSKVSIHYDLKEELENAQTKEEVTAIYKKHVSDYPDNEEFVELMQDRIQEIQEEQEHKEVLANSRLEKAILKINSGQYTVKQLKERFNLTSEQLEKVNKEINKNG